MIIANNVLAHVPDLNGFVAGIARAAQADDGVVTDREPLRARPDRPLRVRHDLPRAPLLLLVHRGATRLVAPPRPVPQPTSSTSPTCTAARCAGRVEQAEAASADASRSCLAEERAAGLDDVRVLRATSPQRVEHAPRATCARCSASLKADGRHASPPTAPRPRAAPCSTTSASAPTWSTSSSTATCTSRAATCPASTCRSCRAEALLERPARLRRCSWPGTSATRSSRQQAEYRAARRPLHRPRSRPRRSSDVSASTADRACPACGQRRPATSSTSSRRHPGAQLPAARRRERGRRASRRGDLDLGVLPMPAGSSPTPAFDPTLHAVLAALRGDAGLLAALPCVRRRAGARAGSTSYDLARQDGARDRLRQGRVPRR